MASQPSSFPTAVEVGPSASTVASSENKCLVGVDDPHKQQQQSQRFSGDIFRSFPWLPIHWVFIGVAFVLLLALMMIVWRFAIAAWVSLILVLILFCLPCCVSPAVLVGALKRMPCKRMLWWVLAFSGCVVMALLFGTLWRAGANCAWSDQTNEAYTAWFQWQGLPADSPVRASLRYDPLQRLQFCDFLFVVLGFLLAAFVQRVSTFPLVFFLSWGCTVSSSCKF